MAWLRSRPGKSRRERLAVYEAQVAAGQEPAVVERLEPEQLILNALHDVNAVLTQIKTELHDGSVNPILLELAGQRLDRLGRLSKVALDGEVAERLEKRLGWMAADRAAQITALLAATLQAAPLTAEQRLAVWESRFDGLQLVKDGQAPLRMLGDETVRFTDGLQVAAALEREAAEGVVWPEPDADSDRVPYLFAVPDGSVNGHG